jgi:hypothetical protein
MPIEPTTSRDSYAALLAELKQRIDSARLKASIGNMCCSTGALVAIS